MANPVCRAYDIYVSETYQDHEDPDGDNSLKAKRRRTDESWRNLPDERRREYEEKAKEEAERRQRGAAMSFPEFLAAGAREGIRAFKKKSGASFKRQAVVRTLQDLDAHPVFRGGANIGCFNSALKPSCVLLPGSDAAMTAASNKLFAYDPKQHANPPGPMRIFNVCSLTCKGLCVKDEMYEACNICTRNLYTVIRRHAPGYKKQMPFVVEFRIEESERWSQTIEPHFLTDVFNKGEHAITIQAVLEMQLQPDGGNVHLATPQPVGLNIFATSHMVFRRMLHAATDAHPDAWASIDVISMWVYRTSNPHHNDKFRVLLHEVEGKFDLSLKTITKCRRAKKGRLMVKLSSARRLSQTPMTTRRTLTTTPAAPTATRMKPAMTIVAVVMRMQTGTQSRQRSFRAIGPWDNTHIYIIYIYIYIYTYITRSMYIFIYI